MHIRQIAPDELETVVSLITRLQPNEEHHIGYFGMEADDIRQHLLGFTHGWQNSIVVALHRDQLVGCLAVEWDAVIGRAWLHGPCINHVAWPIIADRLYAGVKELGVLPIELEEELLGDVVNVKLGAFARRHFFRKMKGHQVVYRLSSENTPPATLTFSSANCTAIELCFKAGYEHLWTLATYRKRTSPEE